MPFAANYYHQIRRRQANELLGTKQPARTATTPHCNPSPVSYNAIFGLEHQESNRFHSPNMATPTAIAAYLLLFVVAGFGFLFTNLLVGKFCRPRAPNSEKLEVYECGEPTIGSSFVQFDLRFYVVALLFIIFDVEIAFFFPWATVFGKATQLMDPRLAVVREEGARGEGRGASKVELTPAAEGLYRELGVTKPTVPRIAAKGAEGSSPLKQTDQKIRSDAAQLAKLSMIDIGAFFAVLLVGFAYVWRRGDLDWVRAVSRERSTGPEPPEPPAAVEQQPVISA